MALKHIDKFVIVILENRSFDHACGYLSLPKYGGLKLEGLKDDANWLASFDNDDEHGNPWKINLLDPTVQNIIDPPHEDTDIHVQISTPTHKSAFPTMGGFVRSYANAKPQARDRSLVMGYYDNRAVPVFDFFARYFAICDHWFCPLPAGTQTNRLMAMSGQSLIHQNASSPIHFPNQKLVYDWIHEKLGENRWCTYQWDGLPFFSLMSRWWPFIVAGHNDIFNTGVFRRYDGFKEQWQSGNVPDVIFIEPKYTDDPTFSIKHHNDDHCPTGISEGQKFLADIYNTIISNDALWRSTMMIVTYDEHGGFFDHVTPLQVPCQAGGASFSTTGVRVPTFVISPYVKPGSVYSENLDTTSILQLLADRFTPGQPYSAIVDARQKYFGRLSGIFDNALMAKPSPISNSVLQELHSGARATALSQPETSATSRAFRGAADGISRFHFIGT